jgi:hypothetical protein
VNVADMIAQSNAELLRLDDQIAAAQAALDELAAQRAQLQDDVDELHAFVGWQTSQPVQVTL